MHRPLTLLFILTCFAASAQKIAELEKRNGFKDLKLGMAIDSVKGSKLRKEFKEKEEFDAKFHVVADKDPRLMKALESIYGIAEYDMKRETYFWKGQSLILKFRSFSRNQLEMIYTSFAVLNQMKVDKGKKVQDIADDF